MKYCDLNICNCRVLLCLLLSTLTFCVYSESDEGLVFDSDGQFIDFPVNDRHITLSSYDLNDYDISFQDILKLDAASIFSKDADLTNGIKGEVGSGGYIKLSVYAYDDEHEDHLIYESRLESDSTEDYAGNSYETYVAFYHPDTGTHKQIAAKLNDIKVMLQSVKNVFSVTKDEYDEYLKNRLALRGSAGPVTPGTTSDDDVEIVYQDFPVRQLGSLQEVQYSTFDQEDTFFAVDSYPVKVYLEMQNAKFYGAKVPGLMDLAPRLFEIWQKLEPRQIDQLMALDSPHDRDRRFTLDFFTTAFDFVKENGLLKALYFGITVVRTGPSHIEDTIKASGIVLPSITSGSPRPIQTGHNINSLSWENSPGVLDEGDNEVPDPGNVSSYLTRNDLSNNAQALVKLTVNPGSSDSYSHNYRPGRDQPSDDASLELGDHITLEVAVPVQSGHAFNEDNPDHYPELENFPHTWLAYFSGEALYQCEPSIQPGEWRPWLGYDSQVHGTAMRKYPDGFVPKFYDWHVDTSKTGFVIFRWTAKMTRRMDVDISSYSPVHTWPKQKTSPVTQRNNQKEGLNMELLRAWSDHTQASHGIPDFSSYGGDRILPGLDPDEFLYLRTTGGTVTNIITLDGEPWKTVPNGEAGNPLNDIVTAYKKNRLWHVDSVNYREVFGEDYAAGSYEIQDLGTSASAPNGNASGNNVAPGRIKVHLPSFAGGSTVNMRVNVEAPLHDDKGFYGNISGTVYPSVWEKGVSYLIRGLGRSQAENYAVSFIYEDSLGVRGYYNVFSENEPSRVRNSISSDGEWSVTLPSMRGYGYYTVNLWFKNSNYTDSWTRIGGKELLDISLRFLGVPAGLNGVSESGYPGVALKESPGDGAHIYLDDFLDGKHKDNSVWRYGRYGRVHARTYVFKQGDTTTFEVFDADPHTFTHRGTEWYMSSRTQAKQISDGKLIKSLKFYVDPVKSDGKVVEDNRIDGSGKKFTYEWNDPGIYQLKAVYRGESSVAHQIVVIASSDTTYTQDHRINTRQLNDQEKRWLRSEGVIFDSTVDYHIAFVSNVYSKYRYINGPRMHTGRQVNRFHPGNDYADGYKWEIAPLAHTAAYSAYTLTSIFAPDNLGQAVGTGVGEPAWLPTAFMRHTSEKNDNNEPMPDDIANGPVSVSRFSNLRSSQEQRINDLFNDVPEPWQVRLPWISFVTDPNPYGSSDILSYRVRTNIKVIYDMRAFFDNGRGAFSGNPVNPANGDYSYENLKRLGIYLHLMDDDPKLKRQFFQNLATGRAIVYGAEGRLSIRVSNARSPVGNN